MIFIIVLVREAAKKVIFLMAGLLRGGGGKGPAIKEKITFFGIVYFSQLIEIWTYHVNVCR